MEKLTNRSVVERMVNVYRDINSLNEDLKMFKDEVKEVGLNHVLLAKVSKIIADSKQGKVVEDYKNIMDVLEEVE